MKIELTLRDVIDAPIACSTVFFVEAGTKYNLDDNVDDLFLQEFTNVDDVEALISMFNAVDATKPMSIDTFNFRLLVDEYFYNKVIVFLAEQFKNNCTEKQLIVQENNGAGNSRTFRVIWYDNYYNEDWVDCSVYLNDVLTCFDIDSLKHGVKDEESIS